MSDQHALNELHWIMDMIQTIDAGLVVIDKDFKVQLWNGFMSNHSGLSSKRVQNTILFDHFPELPEHWLRKKVESVFLLKNNAFTSWELRPYIFRFNNYRPVTGISEFMYQNMTIMPLTSLTGEITHVSLIIYDVTDIANNRIQLDKANEQLATLSQTDGLTRLNNRLHWNELCHREFQRLKRYGGLSTMLMLDVDFFKKVNDSYGHIAGDKVIIAVADVIQRNCRVTDFSARYGGEEFAICLTNTSAKDAVTIANRLLQDVEKQMVLEGEEQIKVTISIGIAEFNSQLQDVSHWTRNADTALYVSKDNGRNQYQVFDSQK